MRLGLIAALGLALAGCGRRDDAADAPLANADAGPPASAAATDPPPRWVLRSADGGATLALLAQGGAAIRLACPARANQLRVNVPGFRPIGSEERLSFGSGGEVIALVADPRGDARQGGVSAAGGVPANLAAMLGDPLSASYGAQTSGPHPAPPPEMARAFAAGCRAAAAARPDPAAAVSACLMQDGERLRVTPLRAIGTEPFWGARIEGRCVTYTHPDDQKGTRVWTRYASGPDGETWSGALGGRRFELRIHTAPGCSDGMSDQRYPLAAELTVNGEQRRGCARPA